MYIKTENETVRQLLEFMANVVIGHGGTIHPELSINHQDEQLWISCASDANGSALLIIPDELFIPVTDLEWSGENGILSYSGDTSQLSTVQHTLLDAMVLLYNATNKISHQAERLPSQLLPADPELFAWTMNADFALPTSSSAQQFIDTRLITVNQSDGKHLQSIDKIMPLIDLLNHHNNGSKFQRTESGGWLIGLQKPNFGSDECFIRYNNRDSLLIALTYGFFEPNTCHLASFSCTLQHPELGPVQIKGTHASRKKVNAPRLLTNEPTLTLQDLVLEQEMLPALRTLLGLAVRSKHRDLSQDKAVKFAGELIVLLIEANQQKYEALSALCRKDTELFPLRTLFGQVAGHQLTLLHALRIE